MKHVPLIWCWTLRSLVPTNPKLLLYLGQALHIVAVVLQSQLGCLQVEADAEVPSPFGHELKWLTCKSLLAQRLVVYPLLLLAIDVYWNPFVAYFFVQPDFDMDIGSFAVFEAEVRLPVETHATCKTTHRKENVRLYTYHRLNPSSYLCSL